MPFIEDQNPTPIESELDQLRKRTDDIRNSIRAREVNVQHHGAVGDPNADNAAAFNAAFNAGYDVVVPQGAVYRIGTQLTMPKGKRLTVEPGAMLDVPAGVTLTLLGEFSAGLYRVFTGGGRVVLGEGSVDRVLPQWWGAVGDNINDDTAAIQAAIDCAVYCAKADVYLPPGLYRTTDTLHVGYGAVINTRYRSVRIVGSGRRYRGLAVMSGTAIYPDFGDRPCINVQGGRQVVLEGFTLIGINQKHVLDNRLGNLDPLMDDTEKTNWMKMEKKDANGEVIEEGLAPTADSRTAPYAGVCIDGYANINGYTDPNGGHPPEITYPPVTYPSFLGPQAQYGKAITDTCTLREVEIAGFVVAVVTQPSGMDGNGDHIHLIDCALTCNVYCISISQNNCRQLQCRNVRMDTNYLAITNNTHGKQQGTLQGLFSGCSFNRVERLFDITSEHSGPVTFEGCYAELLGQLGYFGSTATIHANPLRFDGCHFRFSLESEKPVPTEYLTTYNYSVQPVTFSDCTLQVPRVFAYQGAQVVFENTEVRCNTDVWPDKEFPFDVPGRLALNALRGLFPRVVEPNDAPTMPLRTKARHSPDVTKPHINAVVEDVANMRIPSGITWANRATRNYNLPAWTPKTTWLTPEHHGMVGMVHNRATTNLTNLVQTGISVTFDLPTRLAGTSVEMLVGAGDLMYDVTTFSRWWVKSVSGTTVTAELLTGYSLVGGSPSTKIVLSATMGNLIFLCSRVYALPYPTFGDTTSGSGIISNVGRSDSWFGYSTNIAVGDYLLSGTRTGQTDQYGLPSVFPNVAKVAAVDATARTVTLDKNATQTTTRRPFTFWVRSP